MMLSSTMFLNFYPDIIKIFILDWSSYSKIAKNLFLNLILMFALSVFVWLSGFSAIKTARLVCLLTACLLARFLACSEGNCSVRNCIFSKNRIFGTLSLILGVLVHLLNHSLICILAQMLVCLLFWWLVYLIACSPVCLFTCFLACSCVFTLSYGCQAFQQYTFWPKCRSVCLLIACSLLAK